VRRARRLRSVPQLAASSSSVSLVENQVALHLQAATPLFACKLMHVTRGISRA
jgi:hypothetical protein